MAFTDAALGGVLATMPREARETAVRSAADLWNLVALADHGGKPEPLAQARQAGAGNPWLEALVRVKRTRFADDKRVIDNVRVEHRPDELYVTCDARLLARP